MTGDVWLWYCSIAKVTVPTLVLHAKDDGIVPYYLGRKVGSRSVGSAYMSAMAFKSLGFESIFFG